MKWKKVSIKNFLSITEAEVELDGKGLVLIEGKNLTNSAFLSNGSGKTSLMEAIVYALYDTTTKGIKADDVVNNKHKKDTSVILEGEEDGTQYRIERYRKHSKHKNVARLFIDDKEVTEKSVRETNKAIEQIVGIDLNTFINSIMFTQGAGAGSFAIATDREKKEILENLVNLEVYAQAQEVAKERVKGKQSEIDEAQRDGERLEWEIETLSEREEEDKQNYEKTKEMIQQEMKNVSDRTDQMADYARDNSAYINERRDEVAELIDIRDNQQVFDNSSITNEINSMYYEIQSKQREKSTEETNKDNLVTEYKKIQTDTHCPICGTELDNEHREQEMDNLKDKVRQSIINIQNKEQELEEMNNTYQQKYKEYEESENKRQEDTNRLQNINQEIQTKENEIRNYETNLQNMKNAIDSSQSTLNRLNDIPKPVSRDKEKEEVNKKIIDNKQKIVELEKQKTVLEDAVKVYSNTGVKSHVLDLITPYLNERANTYLNKLTGSDIEVVFSTQTRNKSGDLTDKFDIQVYNSTGGTTYQANSEGEKKRIDLAISLAIQDLVLSKSNMTTNFVVYDEVFDALDAVGSENVISLLKERLDTVGTIFVITHSDTLKSLFENVLTVIKTEQGESKIEEEEKIA